MGDVEVNAAVGHIGKLHGDGSLNDRIFDVMERIEAILDNKPEPEKSWR